jgi:hypothetical protein
MARNRTKKTKVAKVKPELVVISRDGFSWEGRRVYVIELAHNLHMGVVHAVMATRYPVEVAQAMLDGGRWYAMDPKLEPAPEQATE